MFEMDIHDRENTSMEEKLSRKSKKPLMEKRRRARINNCLLQLKSLVLQAMKKDATHYSKLEKADILEMTVKYLRSMQRRQITSAMAADPTVAAKYSLGYSECASEVARYLGASQGINDNVRNRVMNHISGCTQGSTAGPVSNGQIPLQPLHVQIPQNGHDVMSLPSERLLVQFPEQTNDYTHQHSAYPVSLSDYRPESKTFEPVLLQNGHMITPHSKQNGVSSHHLKCDVYSNQSKFMDLIRDSRLDNKSALSEPICLKMEISRHRSSPSTSSSLSALKDEPVWRPW